MKADLESNDAYAILGVPRDASAGDIRQAFRKLALKYHPDALPPDDKEDAGKVFARINQAHEVLKDPDKRRQYDAARDCGVVPDLGQVKGEEFGSLASILGEIRSLNVEADEEELLSEVDKKLRDELLLPSLVRSGGVNESVLDVLKVDDIISSRNIEFPSGSGCGQERREQDFVRLISSPRGEKFLQVLAEAFLARRRAEKKKPYSSDMLTGQLIEDYELCLARSGDAVNVITAKEWLRDAASKRVARELFLGFCANCLFGGHCTTPAAVGVLPQSNLEERSAWVSIT